jgi:hypothetical protein
MPRRLLPVDSREQFFSIELIELNTSSVEMENRQACV